MALRGDIEAADLRRLAKASKDAGQSRRLLALAESRAHGYRYKSWFRLGFDQLRKWILHLWVPNFRVS